METVGSDFSSKKLGWRMKGETGRYGRQPPNQGKYCLLWEPPEMLGCREKRKNLWGSGNYTGTFIRVGRGSRIFPSSPQRRSWTLSKESVPVLSVYPPLIT